MTFLNATLVFAVAAIAVPVVLHLISRREPKKVVFPSIRFLTKKVESNRSKLRVRRWWLLALRMAALAALAIALARPTIDQSLSVTWLTIGLVIFAGVALLVMASVAISRGHSKNLSVALTATALVALLIGLIWGGYIWASGKKPPVDNAAPAAIAIILDNSPTALWKTPDDDRLEKMKQTARWMISRLPPTSRIAIIDRSSTPAAFSLDIATAISKVDQLRPIEVVQPIASRVDAAARLIRTSDLENRQLLLITNLDSTSWSESKIDPQLASTLTQDPAVSLTVFDLGAFHATNRSLSLPRLSDLTPPRGVPVPLSCTLTRTDVDAGAVPISVTAELELYENDPALPVVRDGAVKLPPRRSVDRTSVQIGPNSSSELLLTIPPMDVGIHHGVVRMVGDDALALDNTRYFSVEVLPPSHILLVGDNVDEANVIGQAITVPFAMDDPNAEYLIERVAFNDLPAVRMSDFDAAILLDPPTEVIGDEMLVDFVARGGSIFLTLGAAAGDDKVPLDHLPDLIRRWRSPPPHTFLAPLRTSHPILAPLSETANVPWADYRIQQYWQVQPTDSDSVLMRYAGTRHPALVERLVPNDTGVTGRWLMLTTPLPNLVNTSKKWNELFGAEAWPAFILVRQIAETISGRGTNSLMTVVGQPQIVAVEPIESDDITRRLQIFSPGKAAPVPMNTASDSNEIVVGDVTHSGTYWLRGADRGAGFSANVPQEQTKIDRIDTAELDQWFGADGYQVATTFDEIELAESRSSHSVSLRSPIMLLALMVFLLELILANRFYRSGRPATSAPTAVPNSGSAVTQ
ncbi:MAG: hypothetical protein HKN47_06380 [Pirellulaceae bacterium]|nr:hypothetical protein [Pirellulaceae bacterium]